MAELIKIGEAAQILQRHVNELKRLDKNGALKPARVTSGGHRLYDPDVVRAYFQEHGPPAPRSTVNKTRYDSSADVQSHQANIRNLVAEIVPTGDYAADLVRVLEIRALAEALNHTSTSQQVSAAGKALAAARQDAERAGVLVPRSALVNMVQVVLTSLGEKLGQTLREHAERQVMVGELSVGWICETVKDLAEAVQEDLMQAYEQDDGEIE